MDDDMRLSGFDLKAMKIFSFDDVRVAHDALEPFMLCLADIYEREENNADQGEVVGEFLGIVFGVLSHALQTIAEPVVGEAMSAMTIDDTKVTIRIETSPAPGQNGHIRDN